MFFIWCSSSISIVWISTFSASKWFLNVTRDGYKISNFTSIIQVSNSNFLIESIFCKNNSFDFVKILVFFFKHCAQKFHWLLWNKFDGVNTLTLHVINVVWIHINKEHKHDQSKDWLFILSNFCCKINN